MQFIFVCYIISCFVVIYIICFNKNNLLVFVLIKTMLCSLFEMWRARRDLNPRSLAPQASTLFAYQLHKAVDSRLGYGPFQYLFYFFLCVVKVFNEDDVVEFFGHFNHLIFNVQIFYCAFLFVASEHKPVCICIIYCVE